MHKEFFLLFLFLFLILDLSPASGRQPDRHESRVCGGAAVPYNISTDGESKGRDGEEYKALQNQLKALMDELKQLEEGAEDRIRKEMIPFIKREIERLREWLKNLRPGKNREEPVMTRFDNERVPGTPLVPSSKA